MQQQTQIPEPPHPAEAIAKVVFDVCSRTLAALRFPYKFDDQEFDAVIDFDYEREWQHTKSYPPKEYQDFEPEHPPNHIECDMLLENMNHPLPFDKYRLELVGRHRSQLLYTARFHPQCVLSVAIKQSRDLVPDNHIRFREKPADAARPFSLNRVIGWLKEMDLLDESDGRIRAKSELFYTEPCLLRSNLGINAIRKIAEWSTGPTGPPSSHLHFHLRGLDGKPTCAREILFVQGISAPNSTILALLHTLPHWSNGRRRILCDLITARWIRSIEAYGNHTEFKSRVAALLVRRWDYICNHLKNIPRVNFHQKGSSAGFS